MSPTKRDDGAGKRAAHVVVVDDQVKNGDDHLEEKSAAPLAEINQMLVMIRDLSERTNRIKFFRREQTNKHWEDSTESSVASREREVGAGSKLRTLEHNPLMEPSNVSPATYFGVRRQQQAGIEIPPAEYAGPAVNMVQAPDPGVNRAGFPAG
uniref:Uncharacterized protein n=1 Tax=Peronospora matthiolae TaxID=2874970 RepID=A0AAV1UKM2_9STRA